jgi:hypothetical protein
LREEKKKGRKNGKMELGGQSEKQKGLFEKKGRGKKRKGITEWAMGLLISFVPKLLPATKYGRDIAPLDKSCPKSK